MSAQKTSGYNKPPLKDDDRMILSPAETIKRNQASGVWGRVTLDALFRKTAQNHPDRIALADAPNRERWTSGAPRTLSYAEADVEVSRLAGLFKALGLTPDTVIGVQLPNTTDAVLIMLAALRAGLIATPVPLVWRGREIAEALSTSGAKAVITIDRLESGTYAAWMREAAVDVFGLRYVFGIGNDLPDGLLDLNAVMKEVGNEVPPAEVTRSVNAADHLATLTWTMGPSGALMPVPRSHNHWISAGLMPMLEGRIADGASILLPYALSGLAGIGCGIAPWLLCGGTLHLHHPEDVQQIARHARSCEADVIVVPGQLAPLVDTLLKKQDPPRTIVAVWHAGADNSVQPPHVNAIVDVTLIDEMAQVARLRGETGPSRALPSGPVGAPSGVADVPVLLEIHVESEGTSAAPLHVRGPMVPERAWPGSATADWPDAANGYLRTRLVGVRDKGVIKNVDANPFLDNAALIGGIGVELNALDQLYAKFEGASDAAAFLVSEPTLGTRLCAAIVAKPGASVDEAAFMAYLDAMKIGMQSRPHGLFPASSIPRNDAGIVNRKALETLASEYKATG
ncbi:class I adenylate-forming enzyme family protein [Breoghania sp. L-A4]|uniref:AMP-binding protein n=1 Tax=Breoghania sp. L-A4 TaxID=2304600 RepID=UPI0013C34A6E|nr:class I adenylate-forming enzyme family protein [Breoghania sp. L-A4]